MLKREKLLKEKSRTMITWILSFRARQKVLFFYWYFCSCFWCSASKCTSWICCTSPSPLACLPVQNSRRIPTDIFKVCWYWPLSKHILPEGSLCPALRWVKRLSAWVNLQGSMMEGSFIATWGMCTGWPGNPKPFCLFGRTGFIFRVWSPSSVISSLSISSQKENKGKSESFPWLHRLNIIDWET